jgi:hypothetical protein
VPWDGEPRALDDRERDVDREREPQRQGVRDSSRRDDEDSRGARREVDRRVPAPA